MGSIDHPVIRVFFIFAGAFLVTQLYVYLGAYVNWPPFGTYPSVGSIPYITVFVLSGIIVGFLWWWNGRGQVRKDLVTQGVIQQR